MQGTRRAEQHGRRVIPVVVAVMALLGGVGAVLAATSARGAQVRVPNLVGGTEAAGRQAVRDAGLESRVSWRAADDPKGTVLTQDPAPGTLLGEGRAVRMVSSSGPRLVDLPAVTGTPEAEARALLEQAGFEVAVTRAHDEEVAADLVVSQDPPATEAAALGGVVALVVSDGPRPVTVPDVVGEDYDDAADALSERRLEVSRTDEFSDSVDAGEVIRSEPPAGTEAPRDSTVMVVVSRGPDLVEVPDVRGEDIEDALRTLEEAGFVVDVVRYRQGRPVKRQDPDPDTRLRRGSTVTLFL